MVNLAKKTTPIPCENRQDTGSNSDDNVWTSNDNAQLKLVWISTINPTGTLDAATWLETAGSLNALGWNVLLVGEGDGGNFPANAVNVQTVPRGRGYFVGKASYVIKALRHVSPDADVVLFHPMAFPWILLLRLRRLLNGSKQPMMVMDTRDLIDIVPGDWRAFLHRGFTSIVHRLAPLFTDGQTVITPRMAELVGVKPKRLLGVWPSGVRIEPFLVAREQRVWLQPDNVLCLIYIGIFLQKRHLVELVEAVIDATNSGMQFSLQLYGDGPLRPDLVELAKMSGGCVTINGSVPHREIPSLLGNAHIGVTSLPDVDDRKYQASSPIKLFEYLAAGMPVLATENVCHTGVVGSGRYAFWAQSPTTADLRSALSQIWDQRELLPTLGLEAAAAADNWTWDAAAAKLDSALRSGLENARR